MLKVKTLTRKNIRVPDDVWMVDLDSATVTPPSNPHADNTIPPLPEQEGKVLKVQLKQVKEPTMS